MTKALSESRRLVGIGIVVVVTALTAASGLMLMPLHSGADYCGSGIDGVTSGADAFCEASVDSQRSLSLLVAAVGGVAGLGLIVVGGWAAGAIQKGEDQ